MVVFLHKRKKHVRVECAGNYFQSQHMSKNSGATVFNKRLAVKVAVSQHAPIRIVGCVLAATR
eukprot:5522292-Karenia_brevis.AAC.1